MTPNADVISMSYLDCTLYTTYNLQNYALKLVYTKKFSPYSLDLRFINSARLRNACFTLLYQGKYV